MSLSEVIGPITAPPVVRVAFNEVIGVGALYARVEVRAEASVAQNRHERAEAGAMRRRYLANPWTKKAAPFVYLGDRSTNTN
jgi:hypothetical protein